MWSLNPTGDLFYQIVLSQSHKWLYPYFAPTNLIWKAEVPSKVKMMVWLLLNGIYYNTSNVIQKRRPSIALSPDWCVWCKNTSESIATYFFTAKLLSSYGPSCLGLLKELGNTCNKLFCSQKKFRELKVGEGLCLMGLHSYGYILSPMDWKKLKNF